MQYVKSDNINDLMVKMFDLIKTEGIRRESRNGGTQYIPGVVYELTNPQNRNMYLEGRTSSIFQLMAESIWLMGGSNKVTGYLEYFLKRAPDYSDDGENWRGGYPQRLVKNDQLQGVLDVFKQDGLYTRRAILSIYDPTLDSPESLKEVYGLEKSRDIPCNDMLLFWVDENNNLSLQVFNRSNDVVFGSGINLYEFSTLLEFVLPLVRRMYPEDNVGLGSVRVFSNNLHAYDFTAQQLDDVLSTEQESSICTSDDISKEADFYQYESDNINELVADVEDFIKVVEAVIDSKEDLEELYHTNFYRKASMRLEEQIELIAQHIRFKEIALSNDMTAKQSRAIVSIDLTGEVGDESLIKAVKATKGRYFDVT